MKKSDLKTGMKVVLGSGDEMIVFREYHHLYKGYKGYVPSNFVMVGFRDATWTDLEKYYDDSLDHFLDEWEDKIVAVYESVHPLSVVFPSEPSYWNLVWEADNRE